MTADVTPDRACLVRFNHQVLAQLLQLPEGCHIDACGSPMDEPGTLRMRLRGIGPLVMPGFRLFEARPTVTRADVGQLVVELESAAGQHHLQSSADTLARLEAARAAVLEQLASTMPGQRLDWRIPREVTR